MLVPKIVNQKVLPRLKTYCAEVTKGKGQLVEASCNYMKEDFDYLYKTMQKQDSLKDISDKVVSDNFKKFEDFLIGTGEIYQKFLNGNFNKWRMNDILENIQKKKFAPEDVAIELKKRELSTQNAQEYSKNFISEESIKNFEQDPLGYAMEKTHYDDELFKKIFDKIVNFRIKDKTRFPWDF